MNYIDSKDLQNQIKIGENFLLLDVRESEEFENGHIKNALLIPWHSVSEKIHGIKADRRIIVYCRTGPRAIKAARILKEKGYKNIEILRNGYEGWLLED